MKITKKVNKLLNRKWKIIRSNNENNVIVINIGWLG